jgi:SAM-dependent methyltransferase
METTKYYETRFGFDKNRYKVWKAINEYLQDFIPNNAIILDIGCGYGDFINGIIGKEKFAIDLNSDNHKFIDNQNVVFICQSVLEEFNLPDNSVDVIFASNLLEHFDDSELKFIVKNLHKKLKKGGKVILIQPNIFYAYKEYWDDYTHKKAFSHISLSDFLTSNEFEVQFILKKFLPFSMKSILPKSYFLTRLYLKSPFKPMAKQMLIIAQK